MRTAAIYLHGQRSDVATYNVLGTIRHGRLVKKFFFGIVRVINITIFQKFIGHQIYVNVVFFRLNALARSL